MPEPFYTLLRILHVGGGWLAFGIAPVALLAPKGGRRHILAGRCFVIAMGSGITAGLILAMVDGAIGLLLFGLVTTFFLGTGYLAPRIGRGSHGSYRLDRILTVVGALASLGLVFDGWEEGTGLVLFRSGIIFGLFGLGIAIVHAQWRWPRNQARWQAEHLTSLLAAYTVGWNFILAQYVQALPEPARVPIPLLGVLAIVWARRRFGRIAVERGPTPGAFIGAA